MDENKNENINTASAEERNGFPERNENESLSDYLAGLNEYINEISEQYNTDTVPEDNFADMSDKKAEGKTTDSFADNNVAAKPEPSGNGPAVVFGAKNITEQQPVGKPDDVRLKSDGPVQNNISARKVATASGPNAALMPDFSRMVSDANAKRAVAQPQYARPAQPAQPQYARPVQPASAWYASPAQQPQAKVAPANIPGSPEEKYTEKYTAPQDKMQVFTDEVSDMPLSETATVSKKKKLFGDSRFLSVMSIFNAAMYIVWLIAYVVCVFARDAYFTSYQANMASQGIANYHMEISSPFFFLLKAVLYIMPVIIILWTLAVVMADKKGKKLASKKVLVGVFGVDIIIGITVVVDLVYTGLLFT